MALEVLSFPQGLSTKSGELTPGENSSSSETVEDPPEFWGIVRQSSALRNVLQLVHMVAATDATVLLLGETVAKKLQACLSLQSSSQSLVGLYEEVGRV